MFDTDWAVKDLKIVCDDGVVETYRPVFAWASSFIRSPSLGIDRAEFEKLDMSDKKAGKLKMLELPQIQSSPHYTRWCSKEAAKSCQKFYQGENS